MHTAARIALSGLAGMLVFPPAASAQLPFEEPPPGITVTGVGLARVFPEGGRSLEGIPRALRDARQRAALLARVHDVQLGPITKVEVDDLASPLGAPAARSSFTAAVATVTFSIPDGSTPAEDGREVSAYGSESIAVRPRNRRSSTSIRRAIFTARQVVLGGAAAAALINAEGAERGAGLPLGRLVSIAEQPEFLYYPNRLLGTFGTGRFCGSRPAARQVRRRRCSFPRRVGARVEATYEAR